MPNGYFAVDEEKQRQPNVILSIKMDCLSKNKVKNDTSNRINVYSNLMSNGRNNFQCH